MPCSSPGRGGPANPGGSVPGGDGAQARSPAERGFAPRAHLETGQFRRQQHRAGINSSKSEGEK